MHMSSAPHLLSVYLNDHHAGAVVGAELARRIAKENSGNDYGRELAEIAKEIEEDRDELVRIMDRLDAHPNRLRVRGAWMAEKVGRLKLNGRWFTYSPLSRLVELEGLIIGITGKLALWRSLDQLDGAELPIDRAKIKELIARAESQRERVERLRMRAASEALIQD